MIYKITHPSRTVKTVVQLPASKSISNRLLMIRAQADASFEIANLSNSDDTAVLNKALDLSSNIIDIGHAGTSSRFLTAYLSKMPGKWFLKGSERIHQRPIGILVDALRKLGAEISYLGTEGCLPLEIEGQLLKGGQLTIEGGVSSQFLSALLLIAPGLKEGLALEIKGDLVSRPYVEMTLKLMEEHGVKSNWKDNIITILPQSYSAIDTTSEADWSAAAFMYTIAGLSSPCKLVLNGLHENSVQGDSAIIDIMDQLGLKTVFMEPMAHIIKSFDAVDHFEYDFTECPDLAQATAVLCSAKNITARFTGLQTLKLKETDRVAALMTELAKVGVDIEQVSHEELLIHSGIDINSTPVFETYHDHRMAMCLAPLALVLTSIQIKDPMVVTKSYPDFWKDLGSMGFEIEQV